MDTSWMSIDSCGRDLREEGPVDPKDWIEKRMGRELKSALGRFCFVAGALPRVRPFLGPLFACLSLPGSARAHGFVASLGVDRLSQQLELLKRSICYCEQFLASFRAP